MASDEPGDVPEPPKDAPARERDRDRDKVGDKDLTETLRAKLEQLVPDLVRRTFTAGLGAVFSTEEGIRKITKDLQLPSMAGNVAGYIADTADNTKDKVLEVVAREVRDFLAHINLSDEITRMLTTLSFEIKTEIRFIPNSERYTGVDPDVKAQVRLKRADKDVTELERDKDATRDDQGRLRRLWRRATGNGEERDVPDEDDGSDTSE